MPKTETTYSDEELGLSPGWDEQLDPNIRRELKQARIDRFQLRELEREVTGYRRTAGFATAGIPQDEKGQAFSKIYEGSEDPAEVREAPTRSCSARSRLRPGARQGRNWMRRLASQPPVVQEQVKACLAPSTSVRPSRAPRRTPR